MAWKTGWMNAAPSRLGILLDAVVLLARVRPVAENPHSLIAQFAPLRLQRQPVLQPVVRQEVAVPDRPERKTSCYASRDAPWLLAACSAAALQSNRQGVA